MKKVLIFCDNSLPTLKLRIDFVLDTLKCGFNVSYVLDKNFINEAMTQYPQIRFVSIENFSNSSIGIFKNIKYVFSIYKLLKSEMPDVVFFGNVKPNIYGGIIARIIGIKRIYGLVSGLGYAFIDEFGIKRKIVKTICLMLYKKSFKGFSHIFFQNKDDRQYFLNKKIVSYPQSTIVNGSGVDLQKYSPKAFPKTLTFLFAARFIKEKGVLVFIEAANILKKKYPYLKFVIGGKCDNNPSALSIVDIKNLSENSVEIVNWIEDMNFAINACSVFVYPSYYREGIPRALLEAIACGRPIITTDSVGCKEAVLDKQNGFKIPIKNVDALVKAMEAFVINPALIDKMGKVSREYAKNFEVHKINEVLLRKIIF